MSVIEKLICTQPDGSISFGNYQLAAKSKADNFEHSGDLYKVKTFRARNGMFVYESVPGTTVLNMKASDQEMSFQVEGAEDAQITLELQEETEYQVFVGDANIGNMKTNLGGKLSLSVELSEGSPVPVKIVKSI